MTKYAAMKDVAMLALHVVEMVMILGAVMLALYADHH
jgi:hypothetical protein